MEDQIYIASVRDTINVTPNVYPCTTNLRIFKNKIKQIQSKYIIMPVDKAGNNFGFICKKFYAQILLAEINSSDTFEISNNTYNNVKSLYVNFLKCFDMSPTSFNIPFVYCTPKFHKNPVKFRFITSSVNSISKDISIILNL